MPYNRRLYEDKIRCQPYNTEYGSDHRPIETRFSIEVAEDKAEPRSIFKSAPWQHIRQRVAESLRHEPLEVGGDVDIQAHRILEVVSTAIQRHVPIAKPSPYAKRWWNSDLNQLRHKYTHWRNRARAARRAGIYIPEILKECAEAKRRFFKTVRQQKKHHWTEFLDNTSNIWQAGRYLDPSANSGFTKIPSLMNLGERIESNEGIASQLLKDFFPPLPPIQETTETQPIGSQLPLHALTLEEVREAIFAAKPHKAPGPDSLPAIVWQQLWPVLQHPILSLFQKSLDTGKVPQQWKIAKIIALRKPDKPDYSVTNA